MNETWWVDPSNLDSAQLGVIDLSIDEHQMLSGPPGSGKTNLLLLKGNQFVYAGRENIRFVVFTRALREFISGGSQKYEFDSSKVKTINGWMMEFLRSERVKFDLQDDFKKDRALLIRLCKEQIERKNYKGVYNAIIVDEGQDCLPEEIQLFHKLAETLLVATDDRQRLYGGDAAMNAWFDVIPEKQRYPLSYHYRNGKKICQVADAITPVEDSFKLLPFCKYDEVKNPSKVNVSKFTSLQDQVAAMLATIEGELDAYPEEGLGVLCGDKPTLRSAISIIEQSDLADKFIIHINDGDGYNSFDPDKRIFLGTIHSGKGLEFRTVHILGADCISNSNYRNLCYTAVTRAKTSLNVYHTNNLDSLLASALKVVEAKKPQSPANELFGRRNQ